MSAPEAAPAARLEPARVGADSAPRLAAPLLALVRADWRDHDEWRTTRAECDRDQRDDDQYHEETERWAYENETL